jgi:hypothetical protein
LDEGEGVEVGGDGVVGGVFEVCEGELVHVQLFVARGWSLKRRIGRDEEGKNIPESE